MKRIITCYITLFLSISGSFAQRLIRGRVVDQQTNQPIAGASIVIGNDQGQPSGNNGEFDLRSDAVVITVSSVGYITKQVRIPENGIVLVLLEPSNTALNEVIVEGNATQNKLLKTPNAIGLITTRDFARTNGIQLHQTLNLIPGVKMEMRNNLSGARIVMRGYGNETNFNGLGYKAYLNGIPITDADGTTFLDDIDFTNLGRVEVIKGPASSLYGNTIGGVVLMQLQKAEPGETSITQQVTGGKYGLFRTNTSYKSGTQNSNIFANYGHQVYEGFRQHGSSRKDFVNLGGDFYLGKRTITSFISYAKTLDYLPGQVDSFNLYNHPDSSSFDYVRNDAHVNTENFKISLGQDYRFSPLLSNNTGIYVAGNTIQQASAAGLTSAQRLKFGGRSVFTYSPSAGNIPLKISFGTEFLKNKNFNKSYTLSSGVLSGLRADQEISAQQYNFFLQIEAAITPTTTVTAGAGENYLDYDIADMRPTTTTPAYTNQSGYKRFKPIFSPKVAILQLLNENISLYGNISRGFSAPSTSQVVITQIPQINFDLKPEIATSYEIGSKGSILQKQLSYDIALYSMDVKDKLVSEYLAGNSYAQTTNAGKVRHRGIEITASYTKQLGANHFISLVKPFISYTFSDYKYIDFITIPSDPKQQINNNDPSVPGPSPKPVDLGGKSVSGNAKNLFNAGLDIESNTGLFLNTTFQFVDKMPVDFINLHYAKAYTLLNAKLGFRKMIGHHFDLDVYGGLDNISDTHYATHIFLNSRDYPKIYNPMPGSTWYLGTSLKVIL